MRWARQYKEEYMIIKEELNLVSEWDKTFPKSDKVDHCKVTFVNRYGITLAADMYVPKGTVLRTLCSENGRERFSYHRF